MKDAPINLPPHGAEASCFANPNDVMRYADRHARAAVLADRAGREERLGSISEMLHRMSPQDVLSLSQQLEAEWAAVRALRDSEKPDEPVAEVIIGGNGHISILPLAELEHEQPLYARPRIKELMAQERQRRAAEPKEKK